MLLGDVLPPTSAQGSAATDALAAFVHFSYEASEHRLVISGMRHVAGEKVVGEEAVEEAERRKEREEEEKEEEEEEEEEEEVVVVEVVHEMDRLSTPRATKEGSGWVARVRTAVTAR